MKYLIWPLQFLVRIPYHILKFFLVIYVVVADFRKKPTPYVPDGMWGFNAEQRAEALRYEQLLLKQRAERGEKHDA